MLHYVVSDYMATGEGHSVCVLVTKAYPDQSDYDMTNNKSRVNEDGSFHFEMPKLREDVTFEKIALRQFRHEFGAFYALSAQYVTQEEFLAKYIQYLPVFVAKLVRNDDSGNLYYASKFHVNYS